VNSLSKKLKVFILGPAYPLRGGLATFDELFCRALNQAGHQAEIISYSLQYPNFLFPGSTQYDQSGKSPEGIKIHTLINSVNPFSWLKVGKFIKDQKPDLILVRYWIPFMGPALGTILRKGKKSGAKVIAICDNVVPHEARLGDRSFTKYFLKSCDGFVTMSKAVMNDLNQFVQTENKKFLLHPLYTSFGEKMDKSDARNKLGITSSDKLILFFGLIRKYKGLDLLLEAMGNSEIKKEGIKLLVAGEFYEDRAYYDEIISRNKLEHQVILHTHFIPNEEVRYYFSATDLLTLPYRDATQSGVTQVAFHFEKPVIVTNVGGLSEIIPDNKCGYVVRSEPDFIAKAIIDFFRLNKEKEFSLAMAEEKKKYDWSIFVNGITGLYNQLK
jgi:D-inositol-3-phosphate glycosyltransferase